MENVDPVGGVIGIAGLVLAVAAFVVQSISLRARLFIAGGCLAIALVGISIVFLAALFRAPTPAAAPVPVTPTAVTPPVGSGVSDAPVVDPATGRSGAGTGTTVGATVEITPEIVTTDYRRLNEDNSAYQLESGASTLGFQYGWVARTSSGTLTGNDCVVIARLTDSDSGVVVANEPSNSCSVSGLARGARLRAGSYRLTIEVSRLGRTYSNAKDFVIRPA